MNPAQNLLHKNSDKAALAACVFISLVLMTLPKESKDSAARQVRRVLHYPKTRFLAYWDDLMELRAENIRLKGMVASLLLQREKLLQFREERERLRKLAAFKEEQFYRLLPAEVIDRGTDRHQGKLLIAKGLKDSLREKMPVLSYEGYVGKVSKVDEDQSVVTIIWSDDLKVSCMDKRSRIVGMLEWKSGDRFKMSFVGRSQDVRVGDTLVTSGFGEVPKGFPIAEVKSARDAPDGVMRDVEAESLVRFSSLEEVFVVVGEQPWERAITYDGKDEWILRRMAGEKK